MKTMTVNNLISFQLFLTLLTFPNTSVSLSFSLNILLVEKFRFETGFQKKFLPAMEQYRLGQVQLLKMAGRDPKAVVLPSTLKKADLETAGATTTASSNPLMNKLTQKLL